MTGQWGRLIALRDRVLAEIEPLRKNKQIGSSLQAKVVLSAPPEEIAACKRSYTGHFLKAHLRA